MLSGIGNKVVCQPGTSILTDSTNSVEIDSTRKSKNKQEDN